MRVLCKCLDCSAWFQHENGCDDEERVAELVARVPRVYDVMRCQPCISLLARNDVHWFFEEFEGISSYGVAEIGPLDLMPCLGPVPCPAVQQEEIEINYVSYHCRCGRPTERVVISSNDLGEHVKWVCPEHGMVAEFVSLNEGQLDIGIVE